MSVPTGTSGAPAQDSELQAIYRGGANFLARMEAFGKAKDAHDAAFAKLQLGQDVYVARENAKALESQAAAKNVEAQKVLNKARADAADIFGEATKRALEIRDAAAKEAAKSAATSSEIRNNANAYYAKAKADADGLTRLQQVKTQELDHRIAAAEASARQAQNAESSANSTKRQAEQLRDTYQAKLAKLQGVLREVMGG